MDQKYFKETKGGKLLRVRVIPNSSKNEIIENEDGTIKIKLTAPPVDGKANNCLVEFLAKTFKVPKTSVEVIKGASSKEKTILFKQL